MFVIKELHQPIAHLKLICRLTLRRRLENHQSHQSDYGLTQLNRYVLAFFNPVAAQLKRYYNKPNDLILKQLGTISHGGKGNTIFTAEKEIVVRVKCYFDKEKKSSHKKTYASKSAVALTSLSTKLSEISVKRIMAEYNKRNDFAPPAPKGSNPYAIDESVKTLCQDIIAPIILIVNISVSDFLLEFLTTYITLTRQERH